ncbi:spike base protein, RCAP_Rcc01079 family [Devosia rhizoryzae]|uniref:Uncharacterized protein n=1 Tax=Devosia rhizoryzae TaxID=2774137 RepID=A0ABX7C7Z2_9HYPH|nr:hypothetical protein [Devosia rhizoryzae]QQR40383.1 hypothetical protein JI748_05095 [Devosia rhizoryzae]
MSDPFDTQASGLDAPAAGAFPVVPDDANQLPTICRALYVGTGGHLRVEMKWGGEISFHNVPDGALLPIRAVKVLTASTASSIVGLY